MRRSRTLVLAAGAFVLGMLLVRWSPAQASDPSSKKQKGTYDFGALKQLVSFTSYLQQSGQTNTLQRFNDFETASVASQQCADLGMTLEILQRLRTGRTNDAYELLEGQLDTDIIGLVAAYRELPASARQQHALRLLARTKAYRAKFPFKHRYPDVDTGVAQAFEILQEKNLK